MIILLSPSKTQDYSGNSSIEKVTDLLFPEHIKILIEKLKKLDETQLLKLLKISPKLASKAFSYYKAFNSHSFNSTNSKQALFAYQGDVYESLNATTFNKDAIYYLQSHLLILSGLYGLVRPLDLIQGYRLEMGSRLYVDNQVLHKYWRNIVTNKINELIIQNQYTSVINLASDEYSQAVEPSQLTCKLINIGFYESSNEEYKKIGIFAKKARGKMARFLAKNNILKPTDIKSFNEDGYGFIDKLSNENYFFFSREKLTKYSRC